MNYIIRLSIKLGVLINAIFVVLFSGFLFAQDESTKQDSSGSKVDTTTTEQVALKSGNNEVELIEITIEAEIEKPRVSILPKRMEPELGEMEFIDRSFEKELKQGPKKPFLREKQKGVPAKLKNIIEKKRKE